VLAETTIIKNTSNYARNQDNSTSRPAFGRIAWFSSFPPSSAKLHFAVSQSCTLQGIGRSERPLLTAVQLTANRRYGPDADREASPTLQGCVTRGSTGVKFAPRVFPWTSPYLLPDQAL
jgi:hypothetical protein